MVKKSEDKTPVDEHKDDRNVGKSPENAFSDGSNQGAHKPGGDAMVTTPPGLTAATPPVTAPASFGAITTSEGSDKTAGVMAAEENARKAADLGQAVRFDDDGKPIDNPKDSDIGKATGDLVPRDERHDSIDMNTGTLTPEAQELRAQHGIASSGRQPDDGLDDAPAEKADAK